MTTRPLMAAVTCLVLVATACGGGSEGPAAPTTVPPPPTTPAPTTTAPPTTTTTTVAPTTTPATTAGPASTTTAAPLPDGDELLAALNRAMAGMPEFLATGRGFIKESDDTPNNEAYVTQTAVGGGVAGGGDFWQLSLLGFATPGLEETFFAQARTVDGVDYEQDPITGVWEIDDGVDPDPVEDAFAGNLELIVTAVAPGPSGYLVTGGYPDDDTVESVTVEIDTEDSRLLGISVRSRLPRTEFEGLIPLDGGDLLATQTVDVTTYGLDVAVVEAPPLGRATTIVPGPDAPFITSIPEDWEQFPEADLQASGLTDAYLGPDEIALLMLTEDLSGSGIGTLEEYADVIATVVLADFDVATSEPARTLQGGPAWIIAGTDPSDGTAFRRLLYVSRDGIGVNLTFVQGIDEETGEPAESWDASRSLIEFMINSFMVRGS